MKEIRLKGVSHTNVGGKLRIQADVSGAQSLWFELNMEYQHLVDTESADAFFVLYTWLAMEQGCDLIVEGAVSKRLVDSINNKVKTMFLTLCPELNDIQITTIEAKKTWSNTVKAKITGFSGGVDSWYTALKGEASEASFASFLFTNVGQHGTENAQNTFVERSKLAEKIVSPFNKPLINLHSNVDDCFKLQFQQRHTICNVACALLLQAGFSEFFYAAGFTANDSAIREHTDMAILDEFLLPLLSTERMVFLSSGGELGRIEKLEYISSIEKFSGHLYVCTEKGLPVKNCGHCFKCRRTQLALHRLGLTDTLDKSFDIDHFYKIKTASMIGLVASSKANTSDLEIVEALEEKYGLRIIPIKIMSKLWLAIRAVLPESVKWRSMVNRPYLW